MWVPEDLIRSTALSVTLKEACLLFGYVSNLMNLMNDQMSSSDRVQPMLEVNCRNIMKRSYKQR